MSERMHGSIILFQAQHGQLPENVELGDLERAVKSLTARHFLEQWKALEKLEPIVEALEEHRGEVLKSEKAEELASAKFDGPYIAIRMPGIYGRLRSGDTQTCVLVKQDTWEPVGVASFSVNLLSTLKKGKIFSDTATDTVYLKVNRVVEFEEGWKEYSQRWPGKSESSWSWRLMAEVVMGVAIIALLVSRRPPALPSQALAVGTTRV